MREITKLVVCVVFHVIKCAYICEFVVCVIAFNGKQQKHSTVIVHREKEWKYSRCKKINSVCEFIEKMLNDKKSLSKT